MIILFFVGSLALAHGGRTNSQGCHNNRKTGGYHCHNKKVRTSKYIQRLTKIAPPPSSCQSLKFSGSSVIGAEYCYSTQILTVKKSSGKSLKFKGVGKRIYDGLVASKSKNQFLKRYLGGMPARK